ncbi:hypothetical protein MtrunA17_Chr3g0127421 [Medicago truncatula]|uniref:Transmembrane protein n=1 Tax=Medicago truncatula TaxID=3880 RepID=A0A396IW62_MEDTR|nr:hypothetical protein MtrunA17_Chr3g0127421 [Medicago truncatula]
MYICTIQHFVFHKNRSSKSIQFVFPITFYALVYLKLYHLVLKYWECPRLPSFLLEECFMGHCL